MNRFQSFDLQDPFPTLISDSKEVSDFLSKHKIIPFAGKSNGSGDALRNLLRMLSRLSPTHASCMKGKIDMAMTGDITLWRKGIFAKATQLSEQEVAQYADAFSGITFSGSDYTKFLKVIAKAYEVYGNCFVEVYTFVIANQLTYNLRIIPFEYSYIKYDETTGESYHYYTRNITSIGSEAEVTPLFPNFKEHNLGHKSILHIKSGTGFYGEPASLDSVLNQYSEFQSVTYRNKQAANGFTGQVILEYEGDNPETNKLSIKDGSGDEGSNKMDVLVDAFSNKGQAKTLLLTERPFGAKPMEVHTINANTDGKYFTDIADLDRRQIVVSHRWSERLLGISVSAGMNNNVYAQDWLDKYETVAADLAESILRPLEKTFDKYFELIGRNDLTGINQYIKNPLEDVFRGMGSTPIQREQG